MTLLEKLGKGVSRPIYSANLIYKIISRKINRKFYSLFHRRNNPGIKVFEQDWDNLIILDGCRNDLLRSNDFPSGDYHTKLSGGSHTLEFMNHNVSNTFLDDVVWVTANPQVVKFEERIYHVKHVWEESWDDENKTVMPSSMVDAAIDVRSRFPDKRIVIHFAQPHYPFVGEKAEKNLPSHSTFDVDGILESDSGTNRIWIQVKEGRVDSKDAMEAYRENLELALPHVKNLINKLDGKTVVTSDHGNAIGDWSFPIPLRIYGHPSGFYLDNLVRVPWVVFDSDDRRKVVSTDEKKTNDIDQEVIADRLEDLGYK